MTTRVCKKQCFKTIVDKRLNYSEFNNRLHYYLCQALRLFILVYEESHTPIPVFTDIGSGAIVKDQGT